MDDTVDVCVLHRAAHLGKEIESRVEVQLMLVAVRGDRFAAHQLHGKVRYAVVGGTGVEDARDAGMIHDRERLALGLETRAGVLAAQSRRARS